MKRTKYRSISRKVAAAALLTGAAGLCAEVQPVSDAEWAHLFSSAEAGTVRAMTLDELAATEGAALFNAAGAATGAYFGTAGYMGYLAGGGEHSWATAWSYIGMSTLGGALAGPSSAMQFYAAGRFGFGGGVILGRLYTTPVTRLASH